MSSDPPNGYSMMPLSAPPFLMHGSCLTQCGTVAITADSMSDHVCWFEHVAGLAAASCLLHTDSCWWCLPVDDGATFLEAHLQGKPPLCRATGSVAT